MFSRNQFQEFIAHPETKKMSKILSGNCILRHGLYLASLVYNVCLSGSTLDESLVKRKALHCQTKLLLTTREGQIHVCRGWKMQDRVNIGIVLSSRPSMLIPFPEPIRVYFVSTNSQCTLMMSV